MPCRTIGRGGAPTAYDVCVKLGSMHPADESSVPVIPDEHPVVLFDGVCNLCNGAVVFIIERDPRARFRFGALQSEAAAALLALTGVRDALPDSMVLVEKRRLYVRSQAALRIARGLRFPWWLLSVFVLLPRRLRDGMYDIVARHRYRWFGKRDACMVPTPELEKRIL